MARLHGRNFPTNAVGLSDKSRPLLSDVALSSGFGFITANWVTYGTDKGIHGVAAWRLPLGLQMLPALILFIGMVRLPRTLHFNHLLTSLLVLLPVLAQVGLK